MLTRKGTLSRKTRASMRRRQASQFSGARATSSLNTRRCSVPNLMPMDATFSSAMPCKSDTDLSGKCRTKLGILQEENRLKTSAASGASGSLRTVSFYGATTAAGMSTTTSSQHFPSVSAKAAGIPGTSDTSPSSLRLCYHGGLPDSSSVSGGLSSFSSANLASGPKGTTTQSLLGRSGGATQTHLSSLRGSTFVPGTVVGVGGADAAVNGVGADGNGKPTPPPSEKALYESTVVWADADDPDQAYSVLGSLCEAGVENNNPCDFIARAFFILSGTWPITIFLVGLLALPLVMTTIGVNYLHECPVEPKLPIYLVVGGCFGIVKLLFLLWKQMKRHKEDLADLHDDIDLLTMTRMTNIALNIFLCVWFAFGHYWVFHIWQPHFMAPLHEPRNWCDKTVFMFSFWQLIICHIVIAILVATSAIMCCCFICVKCLIADVKR